MTGTCPDLLAALKQRLHDLELEKARAYARATDVQDLIDMIEQPQHVRWRRRRTEATEPPQHVHGAAHQPQPSSPDELFPDPQDTPESAQ